MSIFQIGKGSIWTQRAFKFLRISSLIGVGGGFLLAALSFLSGNTISINGNALLGWNGVWIVTAALGVAGFLFGWIGFFVFSALGIAASKGK